MSLEITGKLHVKYETQQVSEKFKKREFVVEISEEINGNTYTNYAKMQLVQAKCDILDRYREGDQIKVSFNLKGNRFERDGKISFITNLDAWRIESARDGNQQNTQSATSQNNSASGYSTPGYNPSPETIDDLPF